MNQTSNFIKIKTKLLNSVYYFLNHFTRIIQFNFGKVLNICNRSVRFLESTYKPCSLKSLLVLLLFISASLSAQKNKDLFIKLTEPLKDFNIASSPQKFIIGSTCKSCTVKINDQSVSVYPTGAFVYEILLKEGDTTFQIVAYNSNGKTTEKQIQYTFKLPAPEIAVSSFSIERIQSFPEGDLMLQVGDEINFKAKAYPDCVVKVADKYQLFEMPDSTTKGLKGIYQGKYIVQEKDTFLNQKIKVSLISSDGKIISKETSNRFSVMTKNTADVVMTKGRLAHLLFGLGDDRLGGAKMGYIDSLIPLKVVGKVNSNYKVRLASSRTAFIPDDVVDNMPPGTFSPSSLSGKIRVFGDTMYDYISVQLFNRQPYQSFQLTDLSKIIVDIFGTTNNTNWIDQLESAKEVKNVSYEQVADEVFRLNITLKHQQHWGHFIYYNGNNLVIKIKRLPPKLSLKNLVIAIDAGHGGANTGAVGPTGIAEKNLTLPVAIKLQLLLEKEGAKTIMTRTTEQYFDNKERILFYRDSTPDLLLSLHLNAANDPIRVGGTSTFYRYEGFRPLSHAIYKRMLELGLKEYGNNGSFNFMLNSPTEYPNALIEMLFLSNPEEEMKILDESFQQKIAEKIVVGIKDFLETAH